MLSSVSKTQTLLHDLNLPTRNASWTPAFDMPALSDSVVGKNMNLTITKASKHVSLCGETLRSLQICAIGVDTGFYMTNDPKIRSEQKILYNYGQVTLYIRPMSGNVDKDAVLNTLKVTVNQSEGTSSTTAVLGVTQLMYTEMERDFTSLGSKYGSIRIETALLGEKIKKAHPLEIFQDHEIVNFEFQTK